MSNFIFNTGKGRIAELANRVNAKDPAKSGFVVLAINANGETDDIMKDKATLAELLTTKAKEVTNQGYARKVLISGDITVTTDQSNDRVEADIADLNFGEITTGDKWTDIVICYDPDTKTIGDAKIVPLTLHDAEITPDGSNITVVINNSGFFRAS